MVEDRPRSRLHRDPQLVTLELQTRDLAVLRDLFYFRWATAPALALTASWANGGNGHAYFPKRLTQLWRGGYVERFHAGYSLYLHGSRHFVYTIGDGKASAAARTGRHPLAIPHDRWRQVLAEAATARGRTRDALRAGGIAPEEIDRVLHNNTELAMNYYAGESSGVRHHVLCTELVSLLWYSARMHGWPVEDILPDGVADLSFREPEPQRYRDLITADGVVPIKPDCLFSIAGHRFAVEAETGSTSATKLRLKLRRYTRLFALKNVSVRLLVYCATDAHARHVISAIQSCVPLGIRDRILVSRASEISMTDVGSHSARKTLVASRFHIATSTVGADTVRLFAADG